MGKAIGRLRRFVTSIDGATAIEYGLLCALLALALVGALTATSDGWERVYIRLGTTMDGV